MQLQPSDSDSIQTYSANYARRLVDASDMS